MKYIVNKEEELLNFLYVNVKKSKNTIKNFLTKEEVLVNSKVVTKYNYILKVNDIVEIIRKENDLEIIYEDKNIIAVNKPSNLLTISTQKEKNKTLYKQVSDYVKKINKKSKIFIVHRLDYETCGIVLFAKNQKIKDELQNIWNKSVTRNYYAVVEGITPKKEDTIKSYLKENKNHYVYSNQSGNLAITHYKVILSKNNMSLLDINIRTGKKNQIRVHLSEMGNPIVGDKKYNSKVKNKYILLMAYELKIEDEKYKYHFKLNLPKNFNI